MLKINTKGIKVLTPQGFQTFDGVQKLKKECIQISTDNYTLKCSKNHPLCIDFSSNTFKAAEDLDIGSQIYTCSGYERIVAKSDAGIEYVYDLIDVDSSQYFTNGILSHNCTFLNANDAAIDEVLFDLYSRMCVEPKEIRDGLRIYEYPKNGAQYVAGVDVAEGVGLDYSVIHILDISDLTKITQVAVYRNNRISPLEFSNKCLEIFEEWGNPIALIERNNQGAQVIDRLYHDNQYANIVSYGQKVALRNKAQIGMISHTNTKGKAVTNMRHFVNTLKCMQFRDLETVKELKHFVRGSQSNWCAENGYNDDLVMALVWGLMILEREITEQYFNILKTDDYGKPLMLENLDFGVGRFIKEDSIYLDVDNELGINNSITAAVFGMGHDNTISDIAELQAQGWTILN